ncbi:MAG: triose-phosphate isomerase [Actinobacteria bacterium]|nr:triose-phosphate isomerase [Actinomycetota bacterium]
MPASNRRPLISGNWKMNLNHYDAIQLVQKLSYLITKDDVERVDVSLHPPFTDIRTVQTTLESDRIPFFLGAQNCHSDDSGAFTGEVSPAFLSKLNVRYVICGHSERRQLFGETDQFVATKAGAVIKHKMTPIVCVGETRDQREAGQALDVVGAQVLASLDGRIDTQFVDLVIAYEPIWAIGTGLTATAADAQEVCAHIRSTVSSRWGADAANSVRIQYGGSVKAGNIAELMAQPDIDGALVGGASLDADEFARIVQFPSA